MNTPKTLDPLLPRWKNGDAVHSRKIGMKDAFNGIVVKWFISGKQEIIYVVKDPTNFCWYRDNEDLSEIPINDTCMEANNLLQLQ